MLILIVSTHSPPDKKREGCVFYYYYYYYYDPVFSERLTLAMEKRNIGTNQLARLTGISRITVRRWERGIYEPNQRHLKRVAAALDESSDYLIGLSD